MNAFAQRADTNYLKSLYDRCLDFSENQLDSLAYCADFISERSHQINFIKGDVLSLRLKGLYHDMLGNYQKAIDYYLQSLAAAQKINGLEYEVAALSDLAILYSHIKQPEKAKGMYLKVVSLTKERGYVGSLMTTYGNLGAIYNQVDQPDSALFYLQEGERVGKLYERNGDFSTLYNNIGNVYFKKRQYQRSLAYFMLNKQQHLSDSSLSSLWIDYLNMADVFIEMKRYDSAQWYANHVLDIAISLGSKSKESDSYSLLAKLYARKKEYQQAYDYLQKWYALDTSLVNLETNNTIAGLQERYDAQKRQRDNELLRLEIEKQRLYMKLTIYLAIAIFIIAALVAFSLIQKRRINKKLKEVNALITNQNNKLTKLNFEKNSLISIVSHDLATPFASIKMWGQVLQQTNVKLDADEQKAVDRIMQSAARGEELIKNILDVEKVETNTHTLNLESFDIDLLVKSIVDDFKPAAAGKNISLHYTSSPVVIISDKQLINRICGNLISNAIKFTPHGKAVYISVDVEKENIFLRVKDEGVGIKADELPLLFSNYSRLSSRPTNGEPSNGLGLAIVKRIVQELNGSIYCESEEGEGSLFTVVLRK